MNEPQPPEDDRDELDERYRRASAGDASRPSERTRAAILAHARGMAEARRRPAAQFSRMHAANDRYWWRAAVASVAIGGLALMIWTPRYQTAGTASQVAQAPAASQPTQANAPAASPPTAADLPAASTAAPAARQFAPEPPPEAPQVAHAAEPSRLAPSAESRKAAAPPPASTAASDAAAAPVDSAAGDMQRYSARREEAVAAPQAAAARARSAGAAALGSSMALMAADPAAQLRGAIGAGDVVRVQSLIAKPGVVEARDPRGRTPLMLAAIAGQVDVLRVLIEAGADVNARDGDGRSALDYARAANRADLATMLEVRGAN